MRHENVFIFYFHGNPPKKGPQKDPMGSSMEKKEYPKNNDMYIELYAKWPDKSEYNVARTIRRTLFELRAVLWPIRTRYQI